MEQPPLIKNLRKYQFKNPSVPILAGWHWIRGELPAHDHDYMEVDVVIEGRGCHQTVFGRHPVQAGDAFVLRPRVWHGYSNCERLKVYNCCFGMELLERELAWFRADPALDHLYLSGPVSPDHRGILFFKLDQPSLKACQEELDHLQQSLQAKSPHVRAVTIGRLVVALGEIASRASMKRHRGSRPDIRMHSSVQNGLRLIEQYPSHPWTLKTLTAKLSNIAPAYLIRLFRTHTGLSPMAYLARHRAERAAALLLHTAQPVKDIGSEIGWNDPNYFARRFRKFFGCSPTAYRAKAHISSTLDLMKSL